MKDKDNIFQNYEQMDIDNNEAPTPNNLLSKPTNSKENKNENNILSIIFVLIIIILAIY